MVYGKRIVLSCPQGYLPSLDMLVEDFLRDGVDLVAVAGKDRAKVEDIIDELIVGDGSEPSRFINAYSGDRDHRFRSIVTGCAACKSCAAQIVWWELRTASNHARSGCFGFPSFGVNGSGGGATGRSP